MRSGRCCIRSTCSCRRVTTVPRTASSSRSISSSRTSRHTRWSTRSRRSRVPAMPGSDKHSRRACGVDRHLQAPRCVDREGPRCRPGPGRVSACERAGAARHGGAGDARAVGFGFLACSDPTRRRLCSTRGKQRTRARGNLARAAILSARAGDGRAPAATSSCWSSGSRRARSRRDQPAGWVDALLPVAVFAGRRSRCGSTSACGCSPISRRGARSPSARSRSSTLVSWAQSLGRRQIVRPLPATREVRMAKRLHKASAKVPACELETATTASGSPQVLHEITGTRRRQRARVAAARRSRRRSMRSGSSPTAFPSGSPRRSWSTSCSIARVDLGRLTLGDLRDCDLEERSQASRSLARGAALRRSAAARRSHPRELARRRVSQRRGVSALPAEGVVDPVRYARSGGSRRGSRCCRCSARSRSSRGCST